VTLGYPVKEKKYTFDYLFGTDTQQDYFYERCGTDIVNKYLEGINATIFAYVSSYIYIFLSIYIYL